MKICILATVLFLTGAAAVFGEGFSMSVGGGGILGGVFTRYTLRADGVMAGERVTVDADQHMNQLDYGFFAFFDATFGTLSVFLQNGVNSWRQPFFVHDFAGQEDSGRGWETVLGISLMGRWPFRLSDRFSVFPMLGMDYHISLRQRRSLEQAGGWRYDRDDGSVEVDADGNAFRLSDFNSFWVNLGGGADFNLTGNLFLRGELLYGFRLMTSHERKNLEMMRQETGDPSPSIGGLTSGPSVRLSAGWRLFTRER